jgi:two-component system NtrC family response regulator
MASILVVEDELTLARQLERALRGVGHEVHLADCGADVPAALTEASPDLVLLDLRLPDASGLELLKEIRAASPGLPVVMMTAFSSVEDAVEAMRSGATDYLSKPLDLEKLRRLVDTLLARERQERELAYHRARERAQPTRVVSECPALEAVFGQVHRLAAAELPPGRRPAVLITGETGTGKGLAARAIHEILGSGPFIEVNCTAMPAALVEAELFGHERGSFTDAKQARTGLFEAAEGGTLFLDEIGHIELDLQAKFLKVIDERRVRRIGSSRDREVNVHVIAATNRDLDRAVREGSFREDLLHRLRVLSFHLPPLRERSGDVPLLARHFCAELGQQYRRPVQLTAAAERALSAYPWPGNVRELRNVMERAILLSAGDTLDADAFAGLRSVPEAAEGSQTFRLPESGVDLEELERDLLRQALERAGGNQSRAARLLGLSRHALRYRIGKQESSDRGAD